MRQYGGEPDKSGTAKGALHRVWIDFKTAFTDKDNLAVLEECEKAENVALAAYEDAVKEDLPESLRSLITQQLQGVKKNLDRVRQLREEAKKNPTKT